MAQTSLDKLLAAYRILQVRVNTYVPSYVDRIRAIAAKTSSGGGPGPKPQ